MEEVLEEHRKKVVKRFSKTQNYIIYFFIFSFLGWIIESIYSFIVLGHFAKRGFLYGPLCPIYGFGALIFIIFLARYRNSAMKIFVYAAVICSVFEYIASYILEVLFHLRWWDYTTDFYNINGRISIFYTLAWGFIGIIFVGKIYPFFKKKINFYTSKVPYKLKLSVLNIACLIFVIDNILSCIKYINI